MRRVVLMPPPGTTRRSHLVEAKEAIVGEWTDRTRGRGEVLDVSVLFDQGVVDALASLVRVGPLVSFGLSRDGGSASCTVTFDGAWDRQWFREAVELRQFLVDCEAAILEETGGQLPSSPPPTASRSNKRPRRPR